MLDFSKPLQTRSGYPARLVYDQFITHPYGPLVFAIMHPDGVERIGYRKVDGSYPIPDSGDQWDVINHPPLVQIEIHSGMVWVTGIPEGVAVRVKDFDIDSVDISMLTDEEQRHRCRIATFIRPGQMFA
jgi:hypothetical protein